MSSMMLAVSLVASLAQAQLLAPFRAETLAIPGNQAGDTAILTDRWGDWRDVTFGTDDTNSGLYAFLVDGGTVPGFGAQFGAIGGIDAVPGLLAFPEVTRGGVIAVSATTAGRIFLFTAPSDGGALVDLAGANPLMVTAPRGITLFDLGDGGALLLSESGGNVIQRWRLEVEGEGLRATTTPSVMLPGPVRGLASAPLRSRVYVSAGLRGVLSFDPLEDTPMLSPLIDAGVPADVMTGLAHYPQRDGGGLLIAAVPARDVFRIYQLQRDGDFVAEFSVALEDGGRRVRGADWIDVWPGSFGQTDAGGGFPSGVLAIVDRASPSGANVKLVPWDALAQQAMPPLPIDVPPFANAPMPMPMPPALPRVTPSLVSLLRPGPVAGVALWAPEALVFGAFPSLTTFGADAGFVGAFAPPQGRFFGVDARPGRTGPFRSGLIAATTTTSDGGVVVFLAPAADGGFTSLAAPVSVPSARGVAIADFGDAGAFVFLESGRNRLHRVRLGIDDAGQPVGLSETDLLLPASTNAVLVPPESRHVIVSAGTGLFTIDVLGDGGVRGLFDAGATADTPTGLAAWPLTDGGLLLVGALPARDAFEVYVERPNRLEALGRFEVALQDGGSRLRSGASLDLDPAPFGQLPDGGAALGSAFPAGTVAFTETLEDGGARVRLASLEAVSQALVIPGSGGGGAGGGSTTATGGGGTVEPEPMGCCTGAPVSASLPTFLFLVWLRRFARRRSSPTLASLS
jgi:hypothetical protein